MKVLSTDMGNIGIEMKMKIQKMGKCRTGTYRKPGCPPTGSGRN